MQTGKIIPTIKNKLKRTLCIKRGSSTSSLIGLKLSRVKVTISPDFGFLVNEEEDDESTDDVDAPFVCILGVTPHVGSSAI